MKDKVNTISRLAEMAGLILQEQEIQVFVDEFDKALDFINTIKQANTADVATQAQVVDYKDLREDIPEPSLSRELLLANAHTTQEDSFVTAKVVG